MLLVWFRSVCLVLVAVAAAAVVATGKVEVARERELFVARASFCLSFCAGGCVSTLSLTSEESAI